jgi:hypothetical protein
VSSTVFATFCFQAGQPDHSKRDLPAFDSSNLRIVDLAASPSSSMAAAAGA